MKELYEQRFFFLNKEYWKMEDYALVEHNQYPKTVNSEKNKKKQKQRQKKPRFFYASLCLLLVQVAIQSNMCICGCVIFERYVTEKVMNANYRQWVSTTNSANQN